jgi:hypothetical protein
MSLQGNQGTGAMPAKEHSNAIKELEKMLAESPSPERQARSLPDAQRDSQSGCALRREGGLRLSIHLSCAPPV